MNSDNSTTAPAAGASRVLLTNAPAADATLSETLIVLRKRRLLLIACIAAGVGFGFFKSVTQPRVYEAFSDIEVRTGSSDEFRLTTPTLLGDDPQRKMLTEEAIIESDTILTNVARDLNLANIPEFSGRDAGKHQSIDDPQIRQNVLQALQLGLKVAQVPKTDLIRISFTGPNPNLAAEIVNKVVADYQQNSYESRYASSKKISDWLSGQLDDLKQQVLTSEEKMMDLQKNLGTLGFDSTHNQIAQSLDDLSKAAGEAKLARIVAESRYRLMSGLDPNSIEGTLDTVPGGSQAISVLSTLRTNLAAAKADYADMTAPGGLGPNHPKTLATKAKIEELTAETAKEENRLLVQARSALDLAKANEAQTNAALEQQKNEAYTLRDDLVEYTIRQREFESERTLYEGLLQKLRTAGIEAGLESLEIDIIDPAVVPLSPQLKSQSTIVFTYLAISLVVGLGLAFLLEALDTGLRSIAEIESITELPSLAIVPRSKRAGPEQLATMTTVERNVNVLTQPKSQFTEAFRSLRTALLLSSTTGREPKYILCTSATPSEGKTTVAGNLAVILAQRGTKVLLIDGDLRRPNIHHRFGLNGRLGLSTVLSGQDHPPGIRTVRRRGSRPGHHGQRTRPALPYRNAQLANHDRFAPSGG